MKQFVKSKDEVLDYAIDWSQNVLGDSEEIFTSSWTIDPSDELQKSLKGSSVDSGRTKIWLEEGNAGTTYKVENEIETNQDRTYEASFKIRVVE